MSRNEQTWPVDLVGDKTEPQLWVIRQSPGHGSDHEPPSAALVVALIDFSVLADDRATFALLGDAWAGARATRTAWSQNSFDHLFQQDGDACQLLGVVLHAPASTPPLILQAAIRAVRTAQPGLCLIVSDVLAATLPAGVTGVVRSATGHSALDTLALVRMLVSLASPNEWACLDVEDVRTVCTTADERGSMSLRLMTGAWLEGPGQVIFSGMSDRNPLARAEALWLHVDAWRLRGDVLRRILQDLRARCRADVTLVFNAPFRHSLVAAWGGGAVSLVLLVRPGGA
jgi:hypothetical protein